MLTLLQLLIFAIALSPRLSIPIGTEFFIRLDDIIILVIILIWAKKAIINKARPPATAIDLPLILFLTTCTLSIIFGILSGTITKPLTSILYILKFIEYTATFYIAFITVKSEENLRKITYTFIATAVVISVIGFAEWLFFYKPHTAAEFPFRIFDNAIYKGDSNHIASFLMIAILLSLSMTTAEAITIRNRLRTYGLTIIMASTLLLTLSREAILTTIATALLLAILTKRRFLALAIIIIAVAIPLLYNPTQYRLGGLLEEYNVFVRTTERVEVGYSPEFSFTRNRLENWSIALDEWRHYPILGTGFGSRHRVFYENQYVMFLAETGIVGFALFIYLIFSILKTLRKLSEPNHRYTVQILLLAVLTLGLASISFTIHTIAEPFWILLGCVLGVKANATSSPAS